jgi:EmrB/QacA subfamily drug resistance transporter
MLSFMNIDSAKRWWAFAVMCLGDLMIVLDMTVVNVALPSIKSGLNFSEASLVWVVNAYLLTFGGFLLLGGRLGDLYGQRRLFLTGITIFTLASLLCGLADSQTMLIVARAIQGVGGAIASAIAFSLVISIFTDPGERARAMGIFGFIMAGGGSVGVLLGGLLTEINWHLNFLINIPIGIVVFASSLVLLPSLKTETEHHDLDLWGAVTATGALLLLNYAIVSGNDAGWLTTHTLSFLGLGIVLFIAFLVIETRVRAPLMPLSIFRLRNLSVASALGVCWSAAMFAWFFVAALYLQVVLGYGPQAVGLAFLPANIIMAVFSVWLSAKMVTTFGVRRPIGIGLGLASIGMFLFIFTPVDGTYWLNVFPSMFLLGLGAGMAFNPILLAAMGEVPPDESGLASGVVNTTFMMGGSIGLAILASAAAARTSNLLAAGADHIPALNSGYHVAFLIGTVFAAVAATGSLFLRETTNTVTPH